jgi:hypothetical protein
VKDKPERFIKLRNILPKIKFKEGMKTEWKSEKYCPTKLNKNPVYEYI